MTTDDWNVSESDVMREVRATLEAGREAVLATVVAVEGNAYRRPGAKMVIRPDGGVGSITAGCIEEDVRRLAETVLADDQPRLETYDLMQDDGEDVWGLGVGCDGIVDVLLEPLSEEYRPVVEAYNRGEAIGVLTVVGGDSIPIGERSYYRPGENGDSQPEWVDDTIGDQLDGFIAEGGSDTVHVETGAGTVDVFIDAVTPPRELVVFGSGHDVGPVVELANNLGFRVNVVSYRGAAVDSDRYPAAHAVHSTSPGRMTEVVDLDADTYTVVMTHNFVDDRLTVERLLESPVPYVGLLGPSERFREIREASASQGRHFSDSELERLYTPAGLDLGGETPYHIAHSIVAELLAVANGRDPGHLSDRKGPIHERQEFGETIGD